MFENAPMLMQAIEKETRSIVSARVAEPALKHFDIGVSMAELSAAPEWTRENLGVGKMMQDPTASPHRSAGV